MRRILLAVDGSEHSNRAVDMAAQLSSCMGVPVDVVHVVPERDLIPMHLHPFVHDMSQLEYSYVARRDTLEEAGRRIVEAAADVVREGDGEVGAEVILHGRPDVQISEMADRVEADAIVMGRRGLGEVKGLFMGSVSTRIGQLSEKTLITVE